MCRDDGFESVLPISAFFKDHEFPPFEVTALGLCRGKILDIGAAAGRHWRELIRRGLSVTALDALPGTEAILRDRDLTEVGISDIFAFSEERFVTLLTRKFKAGIAAETKDGKHLGFIAMEKFGTFRKWVRFEVKTGELPPGTDYLRPAVFCHDADPNNPTAIGEIFLDDLIFGEVGAKGL